MQGGYAGWPPSFVGRLADGDAAAYADAIGRLALAVFAYLEFTDGANWLRRLLGATIMAYLVGHALH